MIVYIIGCLNYTCLHLLRHFTKGFPRSICFMQFPHTLLYNVVNFLCSVLKLLDLFFHFFQLGNLLFVLIASIREALREGVHLGLQSYG